jgi:hypothetical protein
MIEFNVKKKHYFERVRRSNVFGKDFGVFAGGRAAVLFHGKRMIATWHRILFRPRDLKNKYR